MGIVDGTAHKSCRASWIWFALFCWCHVTQGARAAVNAAILLDIFLNPKAVVYLYFLIPIPAALLVRIFSNFFKSTVFSCSEQNFFISSHFRVQFWLVLIYTWWRWYVLWLYASVSFFYNNWMFWCDYFTCVAYELFLFVLLLT